MSTWVKNFQKNWRKFSFTSLFFLCLPLYSADVSIDSINQDLKACYKELQQIYAISTEKGISEEEKKRALESIIKLREQIKRLKQQSIETLQTSNVQEGYQIWQQGEFSLAQFVMQYAPTHSLYLCNSQLDDIKIKIWGDLPILAESQSEFFEWILMQHGVGLVKRNEYICELVSATSIKHGICAIVNTPGDLLLLPQNAPIIYVLQVPLEEWASTLQTIQQFTQQDSLSYQIATSQIFIRATPSIIADLLKILQFITSHQKKQEQEILVLNHLKSDEIQPILEQIFPHTNSISIIPLKYHPNALCVIGGAEHIATFKTAIARLEAGLSDINQKTVHWYQCKHSDPQELAKTLESVYSILKETLDIDKNSENSPKSDSKFIVDPKTGSIIFVAERHHLNHIEQLAKRLDVPKKMVQIDVLLFEKQITNRQEIGLNLLRLGGNQIGADGRGISWNESKNSKSKGILEFLVTNKRSNRMSGFDIAYQFLMTHEGVQINANPSVVTVNQTPAKIDIVQEKSIDMGAVSSKGGQKAEKIFSRKEYGIHLNLTPTVHLSDTSEDNCDFITLKTEIEFGHVQGSNNERPDVIKRRIQNEVRIANGQTIILGGLRTKESDQKKEMVPFLGEIPGIGKLFSYDASGEQSKEMFIFLTPKIIEDGKSDFYKQQQSDLQKRPGDTPEFLSLLTEAQEKERKQKFRHTLHMLLGE